MNYLGHIYLSGNNEQLMIGNFIGDYVKGKQYENYPDEIRKGILLHRVIDDFTDKNEHWLEIRELLKPLYKRYAGVVADILVDHYLAKNWDQFSSTQLNLYSEWVYAVLQKNYVVLPQRVQYFLPYLIQHKRLQSYAKKSGLEMSLRIMSDRTSLPDHTDEVMQLINNEYPIFKKYSLLFLEEVRLFIKQNNNS